MRPIPRAQGRGFTLLEMLIALSIFAVLSAMAYGGLRSVIQTREGIEAAGGELRRLQGAWVLLERDLLQAVPRPGRSDLGDPRPAFVLEREPMRLTLSAPGWGLRPEVVDRGLHRIEYRVRDGRLLRRTWPTTDPGDPDPITETTVLEGVQALRVEVRGEEKEEGGQGRNEWRNEWQSAWMPGRDPVEALTQLPRAVRVTLSLTRMRELVWVFALTGAE